MELAVDKFKRDINIWLLHDFPAVVSEIVDLTLANDGGLRPGKANEILLVLIHLRVKRPLSHCLRAAKHRPELSYLPRRGIFRCEMALVKAFLFVNSYKKSN